MDQVFVVKSKIHPKVSKESKTLGSVNLGISRIKVDKKQLLW